MHKVNDSNGNWYPSGNNYSVSDGGFYNAYFRPNANGNGDWYERYIYLQHINTYTVTWKNADGTVLETDVNVSEGTIPTYNGEQPTKAADVQYTYSFTGWTPAIKPVTGDVIYTATYSATENGVFIANSISLQGDICLNYYLNLTAEQAEKATVNFSWEVGNKENHAETKVRASANTPYYIATCPVAVAEMNCDVTATITIDDNTLDESKVFSVVKYANIILSDDYKEQFLSDSKHTEEDYVKLANMVRSMLDYGSRAQIRFDKNTDNLANGGTYTMPDTFTDDIPDTRSNMDASAYGLEYTGSTVVLLTQTSIRHYYKITEETEFDKVKDSVIFNGKPVNYTVKGDEIYFELKNISASNIDTPYTLRIGATDYTYAVTDYIRNCLSKTGEDANLNTQALV